MKRLVATSGNANYSAWNFPYEIYLQQDNEEIITTEIELQWQF